MHNRLHTVMPTAKHTHTMIMLHGRDSTASEFAPEFFESQASDDRTLPEIFPGIKWVFPTANVLLSARFEAEMSQWFDMHSTEDPHERANEQIADLDSTIDFIKEVIDTEAAIIGLQRLFLGGISQGGASAIHALLQNGQRLAGFVGLCTWLPKHELANRSNPAVRTPVFLSHSTDDDVISITFGSALRDGLNGIGMHVEWHSYADGGHWVNEPYGVDDIVAFMRRLL